jgi:polyisoprenoid-binding protein YceI
MRAVVTGLAVVCHLVAPIRFGVSAKSILVALSLAGAAAGGTTTWRVEQGEVRVVCPMTIGGSFDATTTALSGMLTAGAGGARTLDGSLAVDLRTLDTGIGLRNEHLRGNYLEVERGPGFEAATLTAISLNGLDPNAPAGRGTFTGSLTLHGVTQPVIGQVEVRQAGAGLRVKASFPVALMAHGIPKPRYLGIGVKDTVLVEVAFPVSR